MLNIIVVVSVEWLVVDESDKLFEEGKTGFRDQVSSTSDDNFFRFKFILYLAFCRTIAQWVDTLTIFGIKPWKIRVQFPAGSVMY